MEKFLKKLNLYKLRAKNYLRFASKKLKKIEKLYYIEVHLAEHCNLNCAYCTHFSPIADPSFCDMETFKKDMQQLSFLTNSDIDDIRLLGGEPLLNKQCSEFFEITRNYFPNTRISLVTNGILLKSQDESFFESCKRNKIKIECTKYPLRLNYDEIEQYIIDKGIEFTFARVDRSVNNIFVKFSLSLKGKMSKFLSYLPCSMARDCTFLKNGKIFHCPIVGNIEIFNKYFNQNLLVTDKDYIDIHKVKNLKEILNFLSHSIPFCRYCNFKKINFALWKLSKKSIEEWTCKE